MILIDGNLLVYAHVASMRQHQAARRWLDDQLNGSRKVGMPWHSLLAFLRLITNPRIYEQPLSVSNAWSQVESWLDCPVVWVPEPTERYRDILGSLLGRASAGGNLVPDAHLAALAIEHGLILCSTDGDFARFPGLRWENPLTRKP